MTSIMIRDVPDETRAELAARAARRGQSMQEYLKARLVELAEKPEIDEWVASVRRQRTAGAPGVSAMQILEAKDDDRR